MGGQSRKKRRGNGTLERETIYGVASLLFVVLALFFILAAFDRAGVVGSYLHRAFSYLFGVGYILLPILSLLLAGAFFRAVPRSLFGALQLGSALVFLLAGLGLINLITDDRGGLIGGIISSPLVKLFDAYVSAALLLALLAASLIVMFGLTTNHLRELIERLREKRKERASALADVPELTIPAADLGNQIEPPEEAAEADDGEETAEPEEKRRGLFGKLRGEPALEISAHGAVVPYVPPPLSLLERESGKARAGDVKASANIIKRTLANFGIDVEIEEVTVGPSITRYAIKPAEGVRLSRILSLQNNLELALAAHPVRIEAPIPGKSLVGIEVPNSAKSTVSLVSLLTSKEFTAAAKPLSIPLGRDVSGTVKTGALSAMPHLLIAGATGAGKSVTIHTIITSLLYRNGPDRLRFILIDPKRVELTLYREIPHLLTPVVTDAKQAVLALKWLTNEMERRYNILEQHAVRDIASYHQSVLQKALKKISGEATPEALAALGVELMPYIVLVIDELADIMSSYPRELEASIVRVAQMSRAVGIHVLLSTQRPSVNVITGLIKANIPARVALQVTSQIDSRTILDMAGAEKLLGAGDMLFISGDMAKPVRLQSGFISEHEVKKVTSYLRTHHEASGDELSFSEESIATALDGETYDGDDDDLYEEARETVIAAKKASTSYLQRRLRIGYSRAARLMDMLEERGVIGPADGARPRAVLEAGAGGDDAA